MESPHGDPTTPRVAPATACACPTAWADEVRRAGQICRKTGRQGRQGGQPDTLSRAGSFRPCLPRLPCPPALPYHAYPAPFLTMPAYPDCPTPPHPVSRLSRVCHIVNRSATRAPRKTAFCQAILLFPNLSKRYALIHNNLRAN